jgi:hypothetical protein
MNMPFGKHKNVAVEKLPTDYIGWALENMDRLRDDLRGELTAELEKRGDPSGDQRRDSNDDPPTRQAPADAPMTAPADVQDRARRLIRVELAKVLRKAADDLDGRPA